MKDYLGRVILVSIYAWHLIEIICSINFMPFLVHENLQGLDRE